MLAVTVVVILILVLILDFLLLLAHERKDGKYCGLCEYYKNGKCTYYEIDNVKENDICAGGIWK